ncbi:hypothetical protein SAMN05216266_10251 [Amycolatopsis marina]|uniref:WD40-like Beta Propeller Repeat n=1 Tax=Amycolatopsis marina TaxID=490629 RepID=A0A1I0WN64_9PSEU|nr:hypothetical protein [Amycolatopsis marina]SFA89433.1 hypothetical protein SAMN05216266_10251 [Amycolatopsis marina]
MRTRVAAVLSVLAIASSTACGSEGAAPTDAAGGEREPAPAGLSDAELSGFVQFTQSVTKIGQPVGVHLTFHDPETGAEELRLDLSVAREERGTAPDVSEFAFTSDFRRMAWIADDGLGVAELNDDVRAFTKTGSVPAPENSFDDGELEYALPQFSPDGSQVWFVSRTTSSSDWRRDDATWQVLSVDAADPSATPPQPRGEVPAESQPPKDSHVGIGHSGLRLARGKAGFAVSADNELQIVNRSVRDDERELDYYTDGSRLFPVNFIPYTEETYLRLSDEENGSAQGNGTYLIAFELTPDGTVSNERTVFHSNDRKITSVHLDTTRSRLILRTREGYYGTDIKAEAEPKPLFDSFTYSAEQRLPERELLGLYPPE